MTVKTCIWIIMMVTAMEAAAQDGPDLPVWVTAADMGLKGAVMSVVEKGYKTEPGKGDTKPPGHPLAYMDTLRVLSTETNCLFDKAGRLQQERKGMVDERKGRIISFSNTHYHYDGDSLSAVVHREDEKLLDSLFLDRNKNGRIRNVYTYDKKGDRIGRLQFTYNSAGRLTTIRKKDKNNALLRMVRLSYKNGRLAQRIVYGTDIRPLRGREYAVEKMDSGRVQHNCFLTNAQGLTKGMVAYVTNANDEQIEYTVADSNRRVTEYRTIAYNAAGDREEETVFTDRKVQISYSYVYDKYGNWIERKVYHNGAPAGAATRHIRYYSSAR